MHVIRLRAPWELERLAESPDQVRCTRHFNKPTGLGIGARVWLVIDGPTCPAAVAVNGNLVGQASRLSPSDSSLRFEITPLLAARNKIEIELPSTDDSDP